MQPTKNASQTANGSAELDLAKKLHLNLDPEVRHLLRPLGPENRQALKDLIVSDGRILKPLIVWKETKTLLDGHHRLELLAELRAEGRKIADPQIVYQTFVSKAAALLHVLKMQQGQRADWTAESAMEAVEKIFADASLMSEIRKASKDRMLNGKKVADGERGDWMAQVGKATGISRDAVYKLTKLHKDAAVYKEVKKGSLTLTKAFKKVHRRERSEIAQRAKKIKIEKVIGLDRIILGDTVETMRKMDPDQIHLTITSPPYPHQSIEYPNYKYDGDYDGWLDWQREVFEQVYRLTVDGGRLALNVDSVSVPREEDPNTPRRFIEADIHPILTAMGWVFRDSITWYKQNAVSNRPMVGAWSRPSSPRIQRNWESVLIYHKGSRSLKGDPKKITIEPDQFDSWTIGTWSLIPEQRGKDHHRAPFPITLPHRLINLYTFAGQVVFDPYVGSGTTAVAALQNRRHFIGIDNDSEAVKYSLARLESAKTTPEKVQEQPLKKAEGRRKAA